MRDSPHPSHEPPAHERDLARYRGSWRGVLVSLSVALALPVLIWVISRPVQASALVVVSVVAHSLARSLRRRDRDAVDSGRRVAARVLGRVTPN